MKIGQGDRLYLFHLARFSVYVSTVGRFGLILHVKYIKSQTLVYNLLKKLTNEFRACCVDELIIKTIISCHHHFIQLFSTMLNSRTLFLWLFGILNISILNTSMFFFWNQQ